jgi:6-phosphogluconolactonase
MAEREIVVCRDPADLAARGADLFADLAASAALEYRTISVALAGGSTPKAMYGLLAAAPYQESIQWPLIHCFWGDERYISPDDKDSNYHMAWEALLSHVALPDANIHRMPTEPADENEAAILAERDIMAHFRLATGELPRFDLILLGLGDDGHTASLFPGKPALEVRDRLVVATPPGRLPPPVDRLTLTLPVLNAAAHVVFLVAGAGKATTVRQVLDSSPDAAPLPAQLVQPTDGRLTWLLDAAAAEQLS